MFKWIKKWFELWQFERAFKKWDKNYCTGPDAMLLDVCAQNLCDTYAAIKNYVGDKSALMQPVLGESFDEIRTNVRREWFKIYIWEKTK